MIHRLVYSGAFALLCLSYTPAAAAAVHSSNSDVLAAEVVRAQMPLLFQQQRQPARWEKDESHRRQRRQLQSDFPVNTRPDCSEPELQHTETCAECEDGLDNDGDGLKDCDDDDCQFTYYCKMRLANLNEFNNADSAWTMIYLVLAVCFLPLGVAAWAQFKDVEYHGQIKGDSTRRIGVAGGGGGGQLGEGLTAGSSGAGGGGGEPPSPRGSIAAGMETPAMELSIGCLNYSIKGKQLLQDLTASFPPSTLTGECPNHQKSQGLGAAVEF